MALQVTGREKENGRSDAGRDERVVACADGIMLSADVVNVETAACLSGREKEGVEQNQAWTGLWIKEMVWLLVEKGRDRVLRATYPISSNLLKY